MASRRECLSLLGTASIATIAGCTGDSNGSEHNITIASSFEPTHITVEAAETFADEIEEMSDGNFTAEVSGGGSYGAEDEISEQVSDDIIEGHCGGSGNIFQIIPEFGFFDNPWVFNDYDQIIDIFNSEEFEPALERMRENGNQREMGERMYMGESTITANMPVEEPDDIRELNLRLPELDAWHVTWRALEPTISAVALDELYSAVEQGLVNATTGGVEQIHSHNLNEVQDYLMLTSQRVATAHLTLSESFYQDLDETYQDIADDAAEIATEEGNEIAVEREQDRIDELAEDMTIIESSDIDVDAMFEIAEPAVEELFEHEWEGDFDTWQNV